MKSSPLREEFPSRPFDETIVRDVLGEPEAWANCISDGGGGVADMRSAVILDVFVKQQHIALYIQGQDGGETLASFFHRGSGSSRKSRRSVTNCRGSRRSASGLALIISSAIHCTGTMFGDLRVPAAMAAPAGRGRREQVASPLPFFRIKAGRCDLAPIIDRARTLEHHVSRYRHRQNGNTVDTLALEKKECVRTRCGYTFSNDFPALVYRAGICVSAAERSQRMELSGTIEDTAITLCGQLIADDFGAIIQG